MSLTYIWLQKLHRQLEFCALLRVHTYSLFRQVILISLGDFFDYRVQTYSRLATCEKGVDLWLHSSRSLVVQTRDVVVQQIVAATSATINYHFSWLQNL